MMETLNRVKFHVNKNCICIFELMINQDNANIKHPSSVIQKVALQNNSNNGGVGVGENDDCGGGSG